MKRLAVFVAFSGKGGVERVVMNLLQGLSSFDIQIDLLAIQGKHGEIPEIPWSNVRLIKLKTKHTQLSLPFLIRYFREQSPDVFMAAKDRAVCISALARRLAGSKVLLIGQIHSTLSSYLSDKSFLRRWWRLLPMRLLFPWVDRFYAVSAGVAEDIAQITGLSKDKIGVLLNPVIMPDLLDRSLEAIEHPWFDDLSLPIIIAVGRLTPEKDFATLIQAFAIVRQQKSCRLLILGEGPKRLELERLISELGISESVLMPGFVQNPYAYMAKSALFVLSSTGEGSPTVLTEALALGIPAVSTDCKSGPREILQGGLYGKLVPVGDHQALSRAMLETLDRSLPADELKQAVSGFSMQQSALNYMKAFGFLAL